jgi:hypothetical protein
MSRDRATHSRTGGLTAIRGSEIMAGDESTSCGVISPAVAPSLMTTAAFMGAVAAQLDALPGGQIPPIAQDRAELRARVRTLIALLQYESERLSKVLAAALQ